MPRSIDKQESLWPIVGASLLGNVFLAVTAMFAFDSRVKNGPLFLGTLAAVAFTIFAFALFFSRRFTSSCFERSVFIFGGGLVLTVLWAVCLAVPSFVVLALFARSVL